MAGTYAIDVQGTFMTVLLLNCSAKRKFGTQDQQDVNAAGVPKWAAECAVTFSPVNGSQPSSEVLTVTIAAPHDPAAGIPPGSAVVLEELRLGLTTPEKDANGRVRGGKPWYSAKGLRTAQGAQPQQRQPANAKEAA